MFDNEKKTGQNDRTRTGQSAKDPRTWSRVTWLIVGVVLGVSLVMGFPVVRAVLGVLFWVMVLTFLAYVTMKGHPEEEGVQDLVGRGMGQVGQVTDVVLDRLGKAWDFWVGPDRDLDQ